MARFCENCGKKNNYLLGNPFSIGEERILCCKCAERITTELFNLSESKKQEDVDASRNRMVDICNQQFSSGLAKQILTYIEDNFEIKEKQLQDIQNKKIEANKIEQQRLEIEQQRKENRQRIKHLISEHMLTTGFNFEGYEINQYLGVVSGQVVLGTGFLSEVTASFSDFFGEESNSFSSKLENAKEAAITKMVTNSIERGGNATIGIDFDYIIFHNNMIGVVVNGTSVKITSSQETATQ